MLFLSTFLYQFSASLQLQKRIVGTIVIFPPSLGLCISKMSPVAILLLMPPFPLLVSFLTDFSHMA